MKGLIVIGLTYLIQNIEAKKCKIKGELADNDLNKEDYSCPGVKYSEEYEECCDGNACCIPAQAQVMDVWLLQVISLTVIVTCLCLTAVLLVCCFWNKCPLYTACRANYNSSDVAVYSYAHEHNPLYLMPNECNGSARYTPYKVTTRKLDDV